MNSLLNKDFLTNEFLELKQKEKEKFQNKFIKTVKSWMDKKTKSLFQPSITSSVPISPSSLDIVTKTKNSGKKTRTALLALKYLRLYKKQSKNWTAISSPNNINRRYRDVTSKPNSKETLLLPFRFSFFEKREKWGRKTGLSKIPPAKNMSNIQWVMTNNFPQNFTVKSKNFHFQRLDEKGLLKIPVAFEIFLNRRFLWNSNKITLQILNRQGFIVSLASDRKFKMTTLKPLFKEAKIKKIAFLKPGYRRVDHQQKVSKIMFSNLQLGGLKIYRNYFSKIAFGKDFSWLNEIQQIDRLAWHIVPFAKKKKCPLGDYLFLFKKVFYLYRIQIRFLVIVFSLLI